VAAARDRGLATPEPDSFEAVAGFGISGRVAGRAVALGAPRYLDRLGVALDPDLAARAAFLGGSGRSPIHLVLDGRHAAILAVADPVKPGARAAVAALRARGLAVAMVTGDDPVTAAGVARSLGIDAVAAGVLPGGKVEAVQRFRAAHGPVAFVGDGINDAPALAAADVGVALASGTDVALDAGSVVLMRNRLSDLVCALRLSRATMRKIKQNLFWALIYNCIMIPLAAVGILAPALAGAAMALSSVSVVCNSLLLKRFK